MENSSAGGSGPITPSCGENCSCNDTSAGNTLRGTWDCKTNQCSCAACAGFVPDMAPTFDSCGGEPFGTWKAVVNLAFGGLAGEEVRLEGDDTVYTVPADLKALMERVQHNLPCS